LKAIWQDIAKQKQAKQTKTKYVLLETGNPNSRNVSYRHTCRSAHYAEAYREYVPPFGDSQEMPSLLWILVRQTLCVPYS
jgi:hypothetical protein